MMERVADYVIRKVNEVGADHIFLISGRGVLYLTDAVAKNENIAAVSTYHEQGASYAAMAYARSNNKIGACLVSTGCASANAVTAALCAYQDNIPVVFISGNNPLKENTRYTGAKIRTYGSQEADIVRVVESVTKYAVMLDDPAKVVQEVEKALYIASEGRKGPVWIDIPLDVQNMRIDEKECAHFNQSSNTGDQKNEFTDVVDELNGAERPILLIGGGARGLYDEVRQFAEKSRIPVVSSPAGADIYGCGNDYSIGVVGSLGGSRAGNFAIQNSDYVLAVGTKLCSQLIGDQNNFARKARIVVVDIDEQEHTKNSVPDRVIISDSKDFMRGILDANLKKHDDLWMTQCLHWKNAFSLTNETFIQDVVEENEIDLYSLMEELNQVLPVDATLITDAGFEELIVPSAIAFQNGQRCIFPAAQGAMGYAIPAIIGAHMAGRKHICCVVGDGSVMMNIQELQIIRDRKIPAKIIVINNNMYAVIRKRQRDLFRKRTLGNRKNAVK